MEERDAVNETNVVREQILPSSECRQVHVFPHQNPPSPHPPGNTVCPFIRTVFVIIISMLKVSTLPYVHPSSIMLLNMLGIDLQFNLMC